MGGKERNTAVEILTQERYDCLVREDFSEYRPAEWRGGECLPQYTGLPQDISIVREEGRTCLFLHSIEKPPRRRRALLMEQAVSLSDETAVEVCCKLKEGIDGVFECWLADEQGNRIALRFHGGCYGSQKEVFIDFPGEDTQYFNLSSLLSLNCWLYMHIQLRKDRTVFAFLNEDRRLLWSAVTQRSAIGQMKDFHIAFAQNIDTPDGGEWHLKALVDSLVAVVPRQAAMLPDLENRIPLWQLEEDAVRDAVQSLPDKSGDNVDIRSMVPIIREMEHAVNEDALEIKCYGDQCFMQTEKAYRLPLRIDLKAKTDSTNIRLYFHRGEVIFNWECNMPELRIHDICTGENYGYPGRGLIPQNEYVDITWIIEKEYMAVLVNGELRHGGTQYTYVLQQKDDPALIIEDHVRVSSAWGSTVHVKSLKVREL